MLCNDQRGMRVAREISLEGDLRGARLIVLGPAAKSLGCRSFRKQRQRS